MATPALDPPALLLDTNMLWNQGLTPSLTELVVAGRLRVYIPTLVHAERIRQIAQQYGERYAVETVRQFVLDARFDLLPFTIEQAEGIADVWRSIRGGGANDAYWRQHRFDIFLCAVAHVTVYTLASDDTGAHFDLLNRRIRTNEIESWILNLS